MKLNGLPSEINGMDGKRNPMLIAFVIVVINVSLVKETRRLLTQGDTEEYGILGSRCSRVTALRIILIDSLRPVSP